MRLRAVLPGFLALPLLMALAPAANAEYIVLRSGARLCVTGYAALRFVGRDGSSELEPYLRALTLFPIGPVNPSQAWTLRHEFLFYLVFATVFWRSGPRLILVGAWILLMRRLNRQSPSGQAAN